MKTLSKKVIKNLYYKEKLSTIGIGKKLKVSPWVILRFMKRVKLPIRTFKEANANAFNKKELSFSIKKNLTRKEEKLKIAGIMLYWAEGGKSLGKYWSVDLANSDSEMIKIFLKFLRQICRIDEKKLRVQLYCYANQDIEKLKEYWYKITNIPKNQFIKPYARQDFRIEQKDRMRYGLIHIRYNDKKLLYLIEKWIRGYCDKN
ncbi:MAG: hypothetical protein ABIJ84_02110 [bacterium]